MDRTETSKVFQKLIMNDHTISNLQEYYEFSFKTVFHTSNYFTYCCCTCAFEHEYFDYIDDSGEINQEMLDTIVENIRNGVCPHVSKVSEEFVTETKVNSLHVTAAVGSTMLIQNHQEIINPPSQITTGLFGLNPYVTTLLKNKHILLNTKSCSLPQFQLSRQTSSGYNSSTKLLYGKRPNKNCQSIKLETVTLIDLSVQKRSTAMVKYLFNIPTSGLSRFYLQLYEVETLTHGFGFLKYKFGIATVFEMAFRQGLVQGNDLIPVIQELFVRKLHTSRYKEGFREDKLEFENDLEHFIETIIVCNQPEALDCLFNETGLELKCRCSSNQTGKVCTFCSINETCCVLRRSECINVLARHCSTEKETSLYNTPTKGRGSKIPKQGSKIDLVSRPWIEENHNSLFQFQVEKLTNLLQNHPYSKDDIKFTLKLMPNIRNDINAPLFRDTQDKWNRREIGRAHV